MIAKDTELHGDSAGIETRIRTRPDLASDNADLARQLAEAQAEIAHLRRQLNGSAFSEEEVAAMHRDAEDGFTHDDYRDQFEEIVEQTYSIDLRQEDEGFGNPLSDELIVAVQIPRAFTFTAKCAVVPYRNAACRDREFVATRLETGDRETVLYSITAK